MFRAETPSTRCPFLSFHGIKAHPQKKKKLHKKTEKKEEKGGRLYNLQLPQQTISSLFFLSLCTKKFGGKKGKCEGEVMGDALL